MLHLLILSVATAPYAENHPLMVDPHKKRLKGYEKKIELLNVTGGAYDYTTYVVHPSCFFLTVSVSLWYYFSFSVVSFFQFVLFVFHFVSLVCFILFSLYLHYFLFLSCVIPSTYFFVWPSPFICSLNAF